MRPVPEVLDEIKATGKKQIFFADSTLAGKRSRTMELMEGLIPMRLRWSALWTANRVLDREFMELARRSGLLHVNIGVESVSQRTLDGMNKRTTRADRLAEVVSTLRSLGISFSFNLIFGWDSDHLEDFEATLAFLKRNRVHVAFFNAFTPHKGTAVYDRYLSEGRITHPESLDRWPGQKSLVHPRNFTAAELDESIKTMYRRFYSWPSIIRRLPFPSSMSAITSWTMNLSQRKMALGKSTNFDDF
jgi:radical SAM superfamily enzyme YgiQ (UPF0313 family)